MPGNRQSACLRFVRVPKLAMAAACSFKLPASLLDCFDEIAKLHSTHHAACQSGLEILEVRLYFVFN
jgi:hypothetical protein